MRKLTDIPLFKLADKGGRLTSKMIGVPLNVDKVEPEMIQEAIQTIDRRFSYSMKMKVISDYRLGETIPVFNKNINLSSMVPAYMMMNNGKPVAVCNLSNSASINKDGSSLNIDNRTLYAMLQTSTILIEYLNNFDHIKINTKVCTLGAEIFSKLVVKILDRHFAVNLNRLKSDTVSFLAAKYFLIYQMERSNDDSTNTIAHQITSGQTSKGYLAGLDNELGDIFSKGMSEFIVGLSQIEGLKKLNVRLFLNEWLKMYGGSTMLALEYLPYFYHMVFSSMIGARLNSEYLIENLAAMQIINLDKELSRLIR